MKPPSRRRDGGRSGKNPADPTELTTPLGSTSPGSDTKRNFKNAAKHHSGRHLNSPTDFAPNHPHPHASVAAPRQVVHPTPPPALVFCRACRPCKHRVGCLGCVGMGLLVPWSVWDCFLVPACFFVECLSTLSSAGDATLSGFHFGPMTKSIDSHVYSSITTYRVAHRVPGERVHAHAHAHAHAPLRSSCSSPRVTCKSALHST